MIEFIVGLTCIVGVLYYATNKDKVHKKFGEFFSKKPADKEK